MNIKIKLNNNILISLLLILSTNIACNKIQTKTLDDKIYIKQIQEWQKNRLASLKKKDGWLSLAGLFWLKEGKNTIGSTESNHIVFPYKNIPAVVGSIVKNDQVLNFQAEPGVEVFCENKPVAEISLRSDAEGKPTVLNIGTFSWYVIKRGNRFAIRLKDRAHPKFDQFKDIESFSIDTKWRIEAILKPYNPPKKIQVLNVLGTANDEECPGALQFGIEGQSYQLDPIAQKDAKQYFIIFADDTNGEETYGAGRFLYVNKPNTDGTTIIDFNKAYNPPCAFTEFATCPLSPIQNRLPLKITAGEKFDAGADH